MVQAFDELYQRKTRNVGIDEAYSPPEKFAHAEMTRVARFAGRGDGQDVEVYEERWPASFWTVKALATPNSVGDVNEGFCLSTGSGQECGRLAFAVARAIAEGMLGLRDVGHQAKQVARLEEAMRVVVEACRTALEDCEAALAGDWEPTDDGFEATANVLRQALAQAEALGPVVRES